MFAAAWERLKAYRRSVFVVFFLMTSISTAARADQIQYLGESAEALVRLMSEVDSAKSRIDLTYFIFNPSSAVTKVFTKKLIAKAKEGVTIRIVLDANPANEKDQAALTQVFERAGIQIKFYRPGNQYNPLNNMRSHAKILLVDGERYITGGRNIEDDYYGASDWMNYIDREVWVKGSSASKAQQDFNRHWNSRFSRRANTSVEGTEVLIKQWATWSEKDRLLEASLLRRAKDLSLTSWTPIVTCNDVYFAFDNESFIDAPNETSSGETEAPYMSGQRLVLKESTDEIVRALMEAERSIVMENYSYLPTGDLTVAFSRARNRGIPVTLITNRDVEKESYAQSIQSHFIGLDNYGTEKILQLSRHGAMEDVWDIKRAKTAFWTIHGKVFVVDARTTIVSSYNIDPRSYHTNLETAVVVRNCPVFAKIVLKKIEALKTDFEKDKSCAKCQLPTRDNGVYKSFLGWIGYNFI